MNKRTYGAFTCAICGRQGIRLMPTQIICGDCRRDAAKMHKWRQQRDAERTEKSLREARRPPAEESIQAVDRRIKDQGLKYGDWSRAESIVWASPAGISIPYDGEPDAAIFRFCDFGGVSARVETGKTPPDEAYRALVETIRRIRADIVVYTKAGKIWLVRK